jgi:hypothetical protein
MRIMWVQIPSPTLFFNYYIIGMIYLLIYAIIAAWTFGFTLGVAYTFFVVAKGRFGLTQAIDCLLAAFVWPLTWGGLFYCMIRKR